jgi:hypothetical protein
VDGKSAFYCDMKGICKSCVQCRPPFQCCYHEFLLTQRECNFAKCFFTPYCPHANMESYKDKEEHLLKTLNEMSGIFFQNAATNLPTHFIPEIMPMNNDRKRAISIAKNVDSPIIAVSLQNFFRGTRENLLLRKARKNGLHRFFDYSGEIVLTTDVKDRLCDRFTENPRYFRTIVEQLKPNYLTTLDTYTYANIPASIARIKMLEARLSMRHLVELDCGIIGLALGATPDQVFSYVDILMKLGCKIIAHPVYEFRRKADTDSIRWRTWLSRKLGAEVLLLSCSPGFTHRMRVYSDYYSTWSWFSSVSSKDRDAHRKRRTKLQKMMDLANKCSEQAEL